MEYGAVLGENACHIWIKTVAYGICAVLVLFFRVEKNLSQEQAAIAARKK